MSIEAQSALLVLTYRTLLISARYVMLVYMMITAVKWGELLVDFPFDPSYTGAALVSHLLTCMHTSTTADVTRTA
jgi:hypothetical protein